MRSPALDWERSQNGVRLYGAHKLWEHVHEEICIRVLIGGAQVDDRLQKQQDITRWKMKSEMMPNGESFKKGGVISRHDSRSEHVYTDRLSMKKSPSRRK